MTALFLLLLRLFTPAQPIVTLAPEVREVNTFTRVAVAATVTVLVHQGSPQRVTIEASPEDLARLETSVAHDELRVRDRTAEAWRGNNQHLPRLGPVTVHIMMPTVRSLSVANGSSLRADTLRAGRLWLEANSSGHLLIEQLRAQQVSVATTSSGKVAIQQLQADTLRSTGGSSGSLTVAGTCSYYHLALSNGGHVQAEALAVETCTATLSSGGRGRVQVVSRLQAQASRGGQLTILGNPQTSSRVSSGGRVQQQ